MMERWINYQTRAIRAEQRLAQEKEEMDCYKAVVAERLANAEKAEERVKGHLRTAREEKTSECLKEILLVLTRYGGCF